MFTKTLAIAALTVSFSLAAGSALAGEVTPDYSQIPHSTLTRAEVTAEYLRAKQAGELKHLSGFATAADLNSRSVLTRGDVHREYVRARDAGEIALAEGAFGVPQQRRAMQ